jgi:hypothetical protein
MQAKDMHEETCGWRELGSVDVGSYGILRVSGGPVGGSSWRSCQGHGAPVAQVDGIDSVTGSVELILVNSKSVRSDGMWVCSSPSTCSLGLPDESFPCLESRIFSSCAVSPVALPGIIQPSPAQPTARFLSRMHAEPPL